MLTISINVDEVADTPITVSRTAAGALLITGLSDATNSPAGPVWEEDATIAGIQQRWKQQRPNSGVFALTEKLVTRAVGSVVAPKTKEGKQVEPYLRLVTKSTSGKDFSVYLNSKSMWFSGKEVCPIAAELPGADVHSNGQVFFNVDDLDGCLAVVDELLEL